MNALISYDWPGNIRELVNLIERAMILSPSNTLISGEWLPSQKSNTNSAGKTSLVKLEEIEREHILAVLKKTNWKRHYLEAK